MKQAEVTVGMRAHVRIGSRLAVVTVEHQTRLNGRVKFVCRTTDTGRQIVCTAARLRAIPESTGGEIVTPGAIGGVLINSARSIEQMGRHNRRGIREFSGRRHVGMSRLALARAFCEHIKARSLRQHPPAFRRGALHCLFKAHAENLQQYREVMGHAPVPSEELITAAMMGDASARAAVLSMR